jgi:hypothetical protein
MLSIFSLQSANRVLSASCGDFSATALGYTDVTNLSVSIRASGNRPIVICLIPDGSGNDCYFGGDDNGSGSGYAEFEVLRDSSLVTTPFLPDVVSSGSGSTRNAPISFLSAVDRPAAGLYTYKIRLNRTTSSGKVLVKYAKLLVYEELY